MIRFWTVSAAFLAGAVSLLAVSATPEKKVAPLRFEDVLQMKTLRSGRALSPNGRWLAFTVKTRQPEQTVGGDGEGFLRRGIFSSDLGCDIFLSDVKTGETRNVTGEKGSNWGAVWSPDGRRFAFLSDRDGYGQAKLWIWESDSQSLRKVSEVAVRNWGMQQIEWSTDGQRLFLSAVPDGMSIEEYARNTISGPPQSATLRASSSESTVRLYESKSKEEEQNLARGGTLGLSETLHDYVEIQLRGGKARTVIPGRRIAVARLVPNGSLVVYSIPTGLAQDGSQQILFDLAMRNISTGEERRLGHDLPMDFFGRFSVSPDGKQVAYRIAFDRSVPPDVCVVPLDAGEARNLTHFAAAPPHVGATKADVFDDPIWDSKSKSLFFLLGQRVWVVPVDGGRSREVGEIPNRQIRQILATPQDWMWSPGNGHAVVLTNDETTSQNGFYEFDLDTGRSQKLLERGECYSCEAGLATVAREGSVFAYVAEDAQHPADLWVGNRASGKFSRLTHLNPRLDDYRMGVVRQIEWLDDDGNPLRGALLLPSAYVAGQRYPLIVLVYGGTRMSRAANRFGGFHRGSPYFNLQLLTTRGYAVLMPDAPQRLGTPMLDLAKTVLPGVNKVIEIGVADANHLGVMGHSYGGYSVLALLVQTRRFQAAVESDGMADLVGFYGEMGKDGSVFGTSSETGQEQMGGSPWEVRERYIENSPLFYLDRVETPLLVLHGAEDQTINSFLGDEIFVALRRLGKVVSYAKYEGEPHVTSAYANQLDLVTRMIDWFDRYVKRGNKPEGRPQNP